MGTPDFMYNFPKPQFNFPTNIGWGNTNSWNFGYGTGFNTTLDLTKEVLPNGNYNLYVRVVNNNKEAKALFTNIAYRDMTRRAKGDNREFLVDVDYSTKNSPLVFSVRDSLISLDTPKTTDPMYNFFTNMSLTDSKLTIKGTSHSVGVSFSKDDNIVRKLVLENTANFKRYDFDLGSITDGDYQVTLVASDNLDKTRAWYNNTVDLSSVPAGNYLVYLENTVNNQTYYGELIDIAYTDFSKINNANYIFKRNDNIRLRVELEVKK